MSQFQRRRTDKTRKTRNAAGVQLRWSWQCSSQVIANVSLPLRLLHCPRSPITATMPFALRCTP